MDARKKKKTNKKYGLLLQHVTTLSLNWIKNFLVLIFLFRSYSIDVLKFFLHVTGISKVNDMVCQMFAGFCLFCFCVVFVFVFVLVVAMLSSCCFDFHHLSNPQRQCEVQQNLKHTK